MEHSAHCSNQGPSPATAGRVEPVNRSSR
jgi:hypothetical protein